MAIEKSIKPPPRVMQSLNQTSNFYRIMGWNHDNKTEEECDFMVAASEDEAEAIGQLSQLYISAIRCIDGTDVMLRKHIGGNRILTALQVGSQVYFYLCTTFVFTA